MTTLRSGKDGETHGPGKSAEPKAKDGNAKEDTGVPKVSPTLTHPDAHHAKAAPRLPLTLPDAHHAKPPTASPRGNRTVLWKKVNAAQNAINSMKKNFKARMSLDSLSKDAKGKLNEELERYIDSLIHIGLLIDETKLEEKAAGKTATAVHHDDDDKRVAKLARKMRGDSKEKKPSAGGSPGTPSSPGGKHKRGSKRGRGIALANHIQDYLGQCFLLDTLPEGKPPGPDDRVKALALAECKHIQNMRPKPSPALKALILGGQDNKEYAKPFSARKQNPSGIGLLALRVVVYLQELLRTMDMYVKAGKQGTEDHGKHGKGKKKELARARMARELADIRHHRDLTPRLAGRGKARKTPTKNGPVRVIPQAPQAPISERLKQLSANLSSLSAAPFEPFHEFGTTYKPKLEKHIRDLMSS